jgi:hypothetical protein
MSMECLFIRALEWCIGNVFGTPPYRLPSQIDHDAPLDPIDFADPFGSDEDRATRKPVARVHNHIADAPALVVDQKILDRSDRTVRRGDGVADGLAKTAEIRSSADHGKGCPKASPVPARQRHSGWHPWVVVENRGARAG